VLTGRERGKRGKVLRVLRKDGRVLVQGVNIVRRHTRPSQQSPGGVLEKEAPLHVSNIALVDPKLGKPTRVGFKWLEDGRKVRVAKRSGEVVDV
jgi:large subunit ribosomal protein L24